MAVEPGEEIRQDQDRDFRARATFRGRHVLLAASGLPVWRAMVLMVGFTADLERSSSVSRFLDRLWADGVLLHPCSCTSRNSSPHAL